MKKYKFTAGTLRGDMIMGVVFPISFMLPALIIYLVIFYSRIWEYLRGNPLILLIMFLPGLILSYFIINKIRNKCSKRFIVYLDELDIAVTENENEIMRGKVIFCNLTVVKDKAVMLDIAAGEGKISFRARPKEYKSITGNLSFNPFGTSNIEDMEQLMALGREISCGLGRKV